MFSQGISIRLPNYFNDFGQFSYCNFQPAQKKKKTGPYVNCRLIELLYIFETTC